MKNLLCLFILMLFTGCKNPVEPETLIAKDYLRGSWILTYSGRPYEELISTTSTTLSINYVEYTGTYSGRTFKGTKQYFVPNMESGAEVEYTMVTQDSIRGYHKSFTRDTIQDVLYTSTVPFTGSRRRIRLMQSNCTG